MSDEMASESAEVEESAPVVDAVVSAPAPAPVDVPKSFSEDYVKELRRESATHRTASKQAREELAAAQARILELEPLVASLERERSEAQRQALVALVAAEKGLPLSLAERLRGDTREELEADAETLASLASGKPIVNPLVSGQGVRSTASPMDSFDNHIRQLVADKRS